MIFYSKVNNKQKYYKKNLMIIKKTNRIRIKMIIKIFNLKNKFKRIKKKIQKIILKNNKKV